MPRTVATILYNKLPEIARKLPRAANYVVVHTLETVEADVKARMAGPKSGRVYGSHIASAPGEAPAIDTGALVNSIGIEMQTPTQGYVVSSVDYAPFLEYGTSKMAARPAFVPAAEAARPQFLRDMRDLESMLD